MHIVSTYHHVAQLLLACLFCDYWISGHCLLLDEWMSGLMFFFQMQKWVTFSWTEHYMTIWQHEYIIRMKHIMRMIYIYIFGTLEHWKFGIFELNNFVKSLNFSEDNFFALQGHLSELIKSIKPKLCKKITI